MKSVLLIDPTGIPYSSELAAELSTMTKLTFVARKNKGNELKIDGTKYWFLSSSGFFPRLIKGVGYVLAYLRILAYIKKHKIDVVHIQWFCLPAVDFVFLNWIKKTGVKIVFTAHNVLPHRNAQKYVSIYKKYYSLVDQIIVHGESIKAEFCSLFPDEKEKVIIEKHGVYDLLPSATDSGLIDTAVIEKVNEADKVCIFFGNMFYNKGVDELVKYWLKYYNNNSRYFLFIVGKLDPDYEEMKELVPAMLKCGNIFYKPEVVPEIELNTYISLSDIVLMPYRHASMSGIIFKTAVMKKPVLTTNTGSIKEYLNDSYSFCTDSLQEFFSKLDYILVDEKRTHLLEMGELFCKSIFEQYSWNTIAKDTLANAYS